MSLPDFPFPQSFLWSTLLLLMGGLCGTPNGASAQTRVIDIYDGTYFSAPAYSSPGFFRAAGSTVFFEVDDRFGGGDTYGESVWTTDGTAPSTSFLKDPKPGSNSGAFRSDDWTALNGTLYFPADDGANGIELWASDGTTSGTQLVKDINSGDDALPQDFAVYDGDVYFSANDGTSLFELWKTDGTEAGTQLVKDLDPSGSGAPHDLTGYDDQLFFAVNSDCFLWKTDGTTSGTVQLNNHNCPAPTRLTAAASTLFFEGFTGNGNERELWFYNGSTMQIVENLNGTASSSPEALTPFDGALFFTAETEDNGRELLRTDGTGIELVKDINPTDGADPTQLTVVGDKLFFVADDGTHGEELWVTDGTTAGTRLVEVLSPGVFPPDNLVAMNGRIYFTVGTSAYGREVWSSDGRAANTVLLRDIQPGTDGSKPGGPFAHQGELYFSAEHEDYGDELWVSSGVPYASATLTSAETVALGDTGVEIAFSDVTAAGTVHAQKLADPPSSPDGIPSDQNISTYRFVIDAKNGLNFDAADVQIDVSTVSGVTSPGDVTMYARSTPGAGSFTSLPTQYDADNNELVASTSSFSEFVLASESNSLPVELTRFEGRTTDDGGVRLTWQTVSETNNAGFHVERRVGAAGHASGARTPGVSRRGERAKGREDDWETVGRIEGSGTTTADQRYQFTDAELPYAADALTYRLKQVDTDGTTTLSDAIAVERGTVTEVQLLGTFPNPARTRAIVRYAIPEGVAAADVAMSLYDVLGRQVRTVTTDAKAGRHERQLNTASLSSGVYVLRLQVGAIVQTQRLTVVH